MDPSVTVSPSDIRRLGAILHRFAKKLDGLYTIAYTKRLTMHCLWLN